MKRAAWWHGRPDASEKVRRVKSSEEEWVVHGGGGGRKRRMKWKNWCNLTFFPLPNTSVEYGLCEYCAMAYELLFCVVCFAQCSAIHVFLSLARCVLSICDVVWYGVVWCVSDSDEKCVWRFWYEEAFCLCHLYHLIMTGVVDTQPTQRAAWSIAHCIERAYILALIIQISLSLPLHRAPTLSNVHTRTLTRSHINYSKPFEL